MSLNKVMLIGRLGKDPEIMQGKNGTFCTMSIATQRRWKDKKTGQRCQETDWNKIVMFGKLAEIAQKNFKKGMQVFVEGSISTKKIDDGNGGNSRWVTNIVGREVLIITSNKEPNSFQEPKPDNHGNQARAYDFDDDIPF